MALPIGPLIGAAGSVISSLFGRKKTENRVNYKQLVADAEAAGFNPLTVLRNGGSAGYMQTAHPALSAGEVIGGALGQVGNFLADFDPMADDKRELEAQLVGAQIANLNASTAAMDRRALASPGSFNVPQRRAGQVESRPSGKAGALSASAGMPQTPSVEAPTVTNPWPTSRGWPVNPDLPDADAWSQRYGEPGEWLGGALTFLGDVGTWVAHGQKYLARKTDEANKHPYRAPPDPYDRKIYIPPAFYGGKSYQ